MSKYYSLKKINSKNATYNVEGNSDFTVGTNTITITVTDSKGLTT